MSDGWGEDFSRAVYRAQFAEGRQIGEPAGDRRDRRAILGTTTLPRWRARSPTTIKQKLRAETEEAQRLGIFGAPSFVAGGELFWGNDRLEQALAHAKN